MASFQKYKTKNGEKWLFKMYIGIDPLTGKNKPTTRRGFKTKKEAQIAATETEKQIIDGTYIKKTLTYNDVFNEWWEIHSKTIKPSTKYKKESIFNKHILPRFGKLKIKDITKKYCQTATNEICEEVDATSTVKDIKIQANLVFKYAMGEEYIIKNPMDRVVIPKKEGEFLAEEEKRNFWEKDELNLFTDLSEKFMNMQDDIMFYSLLYIGYRKGEMAAIEWDDHDFKEQEVKINKTMYFEDGKEIIQKAKTPKAKRRVNFDEDVAKKLLKWRREQRKMFLALGMSAPKYVFTRSDGRPLRLAYVNDRLKGFIKEHDLHPITVHGLRHTHASLCFAAGASIKDVQERLGHRDAQTTTNIYTHVTHASKKETASKLRNYLKAK